MCLQQNKTKQNIDNVQLAQVMDFSNSKMQRHGALFIFFLSFLRGGGGGACANEAGRETATIRHGPQNDNRADAIRAKLLAAINKERFQMIDRGTVEILRHGEKECGCLGDDDKS